MRVRIGISDTSRDIELEVDDPQAIIDEIEQAFSDNKLLVWFTDTKDHKVGIPVAKIAYVEVEPDHKVAVGFTAGG